MKKINLKGWKMNEWLIGFIIVTFVLTAYILERLKDS